jgi:outer membrane immunogenic protein
MKNQIVVVIALATLASGTAIAADLPVKAPRPAVVAAPACAQFGGLYIGAHGGYGYYNYKYHDKGNLVQTIDADLPTSIHMTDDSWHGGVQAGYNWQRNCTVFGFEADWAWTGMKAKDTFFDGDAGTQDTLTVESKMRWFGTVRTRAGIVVDNLMLYATGGFAYAQFKREFTVFEDGPVTTAAFNSSRTRWGWTAGVGGEWALGSNWSIKSEFLYMRFVNDERSFPAVTVNGVNFGVPGRSYSFNNEDEAWVTRIGLNYRFGGGAPIVARY